MCLVQQKVVVLQVWLNAMGLQVVRQVMVLLWVDSPGSIGFMRSQGRVIKGKKLPGHMGVEQRVMKNLRDCSRLNAESKLVFVKGSVPGNLDHLFLFKKV